jgi:hypothetical protein
VPAPKKHEPFVMIVRESVWLIASFGDLVQRIAAVQLAVLADAIENDESCRSLRIRPSVSSAANHVQTDFNLENREKARA